MDVNEWMSHECSDEGIHTPDIYNSSTHSHAPEDENHITRIARRGNVS
jgi:hypothetical protein